MSCTTPTQLEPEDSGTKFAFPPSGFFTTIEMMIDCHLCGVRRSGGVHFFSFEEMERYVHQGGLCPLRQEAP